MGGIKSLAGDTAIYGVSTILGRLLNYLLVPLYTGIFLPSEYGVVTELMSYAGFFNVIYLYGMETGFFRYASGENPQGYYSSCFTIILISSTAFSLILAAAASPISTTLDYQGMEIWIYLMSSIFFVDALSALPFAKLRLERRAVKFASLKLTSILLTIGLNLLFLLVIPGFIGDDHGSGLAQLYTQVPKVTYIFIANLLANAIVLLLLMGEIMKVDFRIRADHLKKLFAYSLPILIIGLAGMTNENLSRLLLKHLLPAGLHGDFSQQEVLGIFGGCYKLSIFMTLAVQAFRFAFEPFFFSRSDDKNSPLLFSQVMTVFVIFGCLVVFFVSLNLHWIAPIFLRKTAYLTGLSVVPVLLMANLFLGIYYSLSVWYKLTDKTIYGAYISVGGAVVTIVLNLVLIPIYGYMGSAYATLSTYVSMSVVSYFLGKRYMPIPYELPKLIFFILFSCMVTFFMYDLVDNGPLYTVLANIFGLVFFGALIFLFERQTIGGYLKKVGAKK